MQQRFHCFRASLQKVRCFQAVLINIFDPLGGQHRGIVFKIGVIVTIPLIGGYVPQDLVKMIVKKAYGMAKQMNIPVLGIVENYSYILCPDCGKKIHIFGESHIDEIAAELEVPVLGRMPLDAALAEVVEKEAFYEAENPYLEVEAL